MLFTKKMIYDTDSKQPLIFGEGYEISDFVMGCFLKLLQLKPQKHLYLCSHNIDYRKADVQLTSRETQIIFLLIRGKSNKMIASEMGISTRTVETHMDNLKTKFDCNSKPLLLEAALEMGYGHVIPSRLFRL